MKKETLNFTGTTHVPIEISTLYNKYELLYTVLFFYQDYYFCYYLSCSYYMVGTYLIFNENKHHGCLKM